MTQVRSTKSSDGGHPTGPVRAPKAPDALPVFTVERFNELVVSAIADPIDRAGITRDWIAFIKSRFALDTAQSSFLSGLPARSVRTVQRAIESMARDEGSLYLRRLSDSGDIEVVCDGVPVFKGAINLIICRFDGFFRHCKWFPRT